METRGAPLYRRTAALETAGRALTALAEGVSLQGTARLCRVGIETVAMWLELITHLIATDSTVSTHLRTIYHQLGVNTQHHNLKQRQAPSRACLCLPTRKFTSSRMIGQWLAQG